MRYAMSSNGEKIDSREINPDRGKYCPACGAPVSLVRSYGKDNFYRHKTNVAANDCPLYNSPESWNEFYTKKNDDRPIPPKQTQKTPIELPPLPVEHNPHPHKIDEGVYLFAMGDIIGKVIRFIWETKGIFLSLICIFAVLYLVAKFPGIIVIVVLFIVIRALG